MKGNSLFPTLVIVRFVEWDLHHNLATGSDDKVIYLSIVIIGRNIQEALSLSHSYCTKMSSMEKTLYLWEERQHWHFLPQL